MTIVDLKDVLKNAYNVEVEHIEKSEESTDGNVYIITDVQACKYVVKIYSDIKHASSMVKLHSYLNMNGLRAPKIINTKDGQNLYICANNGCSEQIVCYSFAVGSKLKMVEFSNNIINTVAKYLRKLHNITNNKFTLESVPYSVDSDRNSVLHFDITKNNIFVNDENNEICFIDFDDAKYGPSVCDVAIAVTNLFINKASGANIDGINFFLDSYYEGDIELKEKELPLIKSSALSWLNSIIDNPNFDTSTRAGLQNKINWINKIWDIV